MRMHPLLAGGLLMLLAGCAAPGPRVAHDPWEGFNRSMHQFNDTVDRAVLKPTARAYEATLPAFVRKGVTNFFNNIDDIFVTVNDLLQLKLLEAALDGTRLLLNTTLGLYGLIDVASFLGLEKRNEDFGQTLGFYGVGPGPYLVLPFLGPRTLRDAGGNLVDANIDPRYGIDDRTVFYGLVALQAVNTRAQLLSAGEVASTAALDEYAFIRDAYLQQRRNLVYDGKPPPSGQPDAAPDGGDALDQIEQLEKLDDLEQLELLESDPPAPE